MPADSMTAGRPTQLITCAAALLLCTLSRADEKVDALPGGKAPSSAAEAAIAKLDLPGVKINLAERCVDVEAKICLEEGTLELVACIKGTKEHESIVVVDAKAMHIHTALLLLGAKPGKPAHRLQITDGEPSGRWVDVPPAGAKVAVSLLLTKEGGERVERKIGDFIKRLGAEGGEDGASFPESSFLFAGSILADAPAGARRRYMADDSGNLVSISTFGDETLCLPGVHAHTNEQLLWEVDGTHTPPLGTKVTLRLRPEGKRSPDK